ncbi:alpha/beta fold hydrolase [Candidatus Dependentiae bacterium]|nr:alpha/beta fold hydrolase [Candidatus Dependentiae bacterium]
MMQTVQSTGMQGGTVRMITLKSGHKIWTRTAKQGRIPIMLLHGGPGGTHEFFEKFEQFLAPRGFQVIVYDQLDSYYSDKSNDPALWTIDRFAQEVEEVRAALGVPAMYVFGYSFGVVLAIEYALRYPQHVKGLVLSNFGPSAASFQARMQYLRTQLPAEVQALFTDLEAKGQAGSSAWQAAMEQYFYPRFFCTLNPMPEPFARALGHLNWQLCMHFFGKNDFVVDGAFKGWDRWNDLPKIMAPTFVVVGQHDTTAADDAIKMAKFLPQGSVHIVPFASHVPFYENQQDYFQSLLKFLTITESTVGG